MNKKKNIGKKTELTRPVKKAASAQKPAAMVKAPAIKTSAAKKLGKGLEDISYLFLSSPKKKSVSKKRKTVSEKKVSKEIKPKHAFSKKALTILSSALKKTTAMLEPRKKEETVGSDPKKTPSGMDSIVKESKAGKPAAIKTTASKTNTKKTEVERMGMFNRSEKSDAKLKKASQGKNSASAHAAETGESESKKSARMQPISQLKSLLKKAAGKPKPEKIGHEQPVSEQVVEDSKFFTGPVSIQAPSADRRFSELPSGYGDTRIVIQVRDPYWLHAYWEVTHEKLHGVRQEIGGIVDSARRILRVYDVTNVVFNGSNANQFYDIDINDFANNWYLNVGGPGRSFCVDIGLLLSDGRFIVLARSNFVTTPLDGPSWITDEEWMVVEDDFNRLYGLSAGLGIGLSSMDLRKQVKEKIRNVSSGILSSPSVGQKVAARKFWLVVNTELIVYGATEPGAKVTVQGQPITLSPDGTFSLRFALPDGEQVIPVKAVSPDNLEERVITPVVKKKTV